MVEFEEELPNKRRKVSDTSDEEEDIPDYIINSRTVKSAKDENYYLDTIQRSLIDFDFEKICSVSLANVNVYCCLVCGKYFQGRTKSSAAYNHSIDEGHHVYLNLSSEKFYILPENYQIENKKSLKSLQDVINLLNPRFTDDDIKNIPLVAYDLNNKAYSVGYIGMNNISQNDYCNVVIQALVHIPEIRNFYLSLSNNNSLMELIDRKSELNSKFGLLCRKMWSNHLFKNHISPHELLQYISKISKKKFSISEQSTPKKFLIWLLNQLHVQLLKSTKKKTSVFSDNLQGRIKISTIKLLAKESNNQIEYIEDELNVKTTILNFWLLTLDLPKESAFIGDSGINEISLDELLEKFNGSQKTQVSANELRTYELISPLPPFLLIHIDRGLEDEKSRGNPIVVKYPEVLDMSTYLKTDISTNYRLLGCIKHHLINGTELNNADDKHEWSINLRSQDDKWYSIQDLIVKTCDYELMFLDQSYIQIWEKI